MGYQGDTQRLMDKYEPTSQSRERLYDALKETGKVTYVNSLIDFNPEQGTASQRVRLPRESLADKEANCIDGDRSVCQPA